MSGEWSATSCPITPARGSGSRPWSEPLTIRPAGPLAAAHRLRRIGLDAEEALSDLRRAAEDKENSVRGAASYAIRTIEAKASDFRTKVLPGAMEDLANPDPEVAAARPRSSAASARGPRRPSRL